MKGIFYNSVFLVFFFWFLAPHNVNAQLVEPSFSKIDSTNVNNAFITDFSDILTARLYMATKLNNFVVSNNNLSSQIIYAPNNNLNLGVGMNYRGFGLNLAYGFDFMNSDKEKYGDTKYFDAQANMYGAKTLTDLYFQLYQGYYLQNAAHLYPDQDFSKQLPLRPDIKTFNAGISTTFLLNHENYSFRAAFTQDAWQKKSSGSVLLGGYFIFFGIRGDSTLIPPELVPEFTTIHHIKNYSTFNIGPLAGYTHTFVYKKHFFLSLTGLFGPGYGLSTARGVDGVPSEGIWTFSRRLSFKSAIGYNSEQFYCGVSSTFGDNQDRYTDYLIGQAVGNVRFNIVYRFKTNVPFLDPIFDFKNNLVQKKPD